MWSIFLTPFILEYVNKAVKQVSEHLSDDNQTDLQENLLQKPESQVDKRASMQINQMFKRKDPDTFWEDYESYNFDSDSVSQDGYDNKAIEFVENALNIVNQKWKLRRNKALWIKL